MSRTARVAIAVALAAAVAMTGIMLGVYADEIVRWFATPPGTYFDEALHGWIWRCATCLLVGGIATAGLSLVAWIAAPRDGS